MVVAVVRCVVQVHWVWMILLWMDLLLVEIQPLFNGKEKHILVSEYHYKT